MASGVKDKVAVVGINEVIATCRRVAVMLRRPA
jgi:hypothetical protein